MRKIIALVLLVWPVCTGLFAEDNVQDTSTVKSPLPWDRRGDQITLRSGKVLQGVRVVSETQVEVKVEVLPGLPILILPASQVVSVLHGDKRLREKTSEAPNDEKLSDKSSTEILPASKMAPDFSKRLATKNTDKSQQFRNRDIVAVLRIAAKKWGVPITFHQALLERPAPQRRCTLALETGQSLHGFLHDTVPAVAPWLQIEYLFDQIEVSLKAK